MTSHRSLFALAAATTTALAAIPSAALELLAEPSSLLSWWAVHGTAAAAIGVLHLVALAVGVYTTVILAGVALLEGLDAVLAQRVARLAPSPVRRWLLSTVVFAAVTAPVSVGASEAIAARDLGPIPDQPSPIMLADLGPEPTQSPSVSSTPAGSADAPSRSAEPDEGHAGPRPVPGTPTADHWLVEAGDNLWAIADAMVTAELDEEPTDAQVWSYWRALIEANGTTLTDPDLIVPGQVVRLPVGFTVGS